MIAKYFLTDFDNRLWKAASYCLNAECDMEKCILLFPLVESSTEAFKECCTITDWLIKINADL